MFSTEVYLEYETGMVSCFQTSTLPDPERGLDHVPWNLSTFFFPLSVRSCHHVPGPPPNVL